MFFCLGPDNTVRRWCHRVGFDRRFDSLVLTLIIISSALLAAEDPVNPDAEINKQLETADIFFTSVFVIEMLLKIVALGSWDYFRDPWNDLDAIVVFASLASLIASVRYANEKTGAST